LKDKCDRVNDILETVGLTHQGFLKLRDKYFEWQENTHNEEVEGIEGNEENGQSGRKEDVEGSNELMR
jgi:hypothetical protein